MNTTHVDALVSIDVGTSGARATAFDTAGARLLEVRRSYPTRMPHDGWAEQDATSWRDASLSVLGKLIADLGPLHTIHAIGLTGQCPSLVPIDLRGTPLRPGIIYRDNRAVAEADAFRGRFGAAYLHNRTGHVPAAFHVAAKILWIRAHEPEVFKATRLFLEPTEFLALALTGEAATDWTMAAASALLDLRKRAWAPELVDALGLDLQQLPVPHPSWTIIGELRPSLVRRFGLARTIPVVAGAGDSIACAFGAGVASPGPASEMAGSSTCLNTVVSEPTRDLAITHYPSAVGPNGYVTEVGINTAGEAVDWIAALMYGGRSGHPRTEDFEALDREAAEVAPGADGLLFIPVLGDGERDDPMLRGSALGLSIRHDRKAWARATLEGVAFGIRAHLEALGRASTPVTELRVSGRPAALQTWGRIKADVLGIPVARVPGDATAAGVALLAGLGVGLYSSPEVAMATACRRDSPIEPIAANHERYQGIYERYRDVAASATLRVPPPEDSTSPHSSRHPGGHG
ncbi:MAG TPA: FGGY family carbohydrate kinase [Candidatus Acidoferrales bacterium]|nr:FGGY family carbohydrate kinase [Candidatus Acidoferrales bacterium]